MLMKWHYYRETDALYIEFKAESSLDSQEIVNNVVVDFGADGRVVGIDIDLASQKLDIESLEAINFPKILATQR